MFGKEPCRFGKSGRAGIDGPARKKQDRGGRPIPGTVAGIDFAKRKEGIPGRFPTMKRLSDLGVSFNAKLFNAAEDRTRF